MGDATCWIRRRTCNLPFGNAIKCWHCTALQDGTATSLTFTTPTQCLLNDNRHPLLPTPRREHVPVRPRCHPPPPAQPYRKARREVANADRGARPTNQTAEQPTRGTARGQRFRRLSPSADASVASQSSMFPSRDNPPFASPKADAILPFVARGKKQPSLAFAIAASPQATAREAEPHTARGVKRATLSLDSVLGASCSDGCPRCLINWTMTSPAATLHVTYLSPS